MRKIKRIIKTEKEFETKLLKEKIILKRKKKKAEKRITFRLEDLRKNLGNFAKIINMFFQESTQAEKVTYEEEYKDVCLNASLNLVVLNGIIIDYNVNDFQETLLFLKESKKQLINILKLYEKSTETGLVVKYKKGLLGLDITHNQLVYSAMLKIQQKEKPDVITLEHVNACFENLGLSNVYNNVFEAIISRFIYSLKVYSNVKNHENFEYQTSFMYIREEMYKHWVDLNKICTLQKDLLFLEILTAEVLLLENEEKKEKTELEQVVFDFKKEHFNKLIVLLKNEEKKDVVFFNANHLQMFYEKAIRIEQKNKIFFENETFFLELKKQIKSFGILVRSMLIKDGNVYKLHTETFLNIFLSNKTKYYIEIQNLIKNLPTNFENDMYEFLEEKIKDKKEELLNREILDTIEFKFLEIELNHYVLVKKAIKTKQLEINKELMHFESCWEIYLNEQNKLLTNFINSFAPLSVMNIQIKKGKKMVYADQNLLEENINQWKFVWKLKEVESFDNIIPTILDESVNRDFLLDRMLYTVIKQIFELFLKK